MSERRPCSRYNRRGAPCQGPATYEVDMPSPSMVTATGVLCCRIHPAEVTDDAWAEAAAHVESGMLNGGWLHVTVRRVPEAPRVPSLLERLREL